MTINIVFTLDPEDYGVDRNDKQAVMKLLGGMLADEVDWPWEISGTGPEVQILQDGDKANDDSDIHT